MVHTDPGSHHYSAQRPAAHHFRARGQQKCFRRNPVDSRFPPSVAVAVDSTADESQGAQRGRVVIAHNARSYNSRFDGILQRLN